jgi:hypothetical protein
MTKLLALGSTEEKPIHVYVNPEHVEGVEVHESGARVRLVSGHAINVAGAAESIAGTLESDRCATRIAMAAEYWKASPLVFGGPDSAGPVVIPPPLKRRRK